MGAVKEAIMEIAEGKTYMEIVEEIMTEEDSDRAEFMMGALAFKREVDADEEEEEMEKGECLPVESDCSEAFDMANKVFESETDKSSRTAMKAARILLILDGESLEDTQHLSIDD